MDLLSITILYRFPFYIFKFMIFILDGGVSNNYLIKDNNRKTNTFEVLWMRMQYTSLCTRFEISESMNILTHKD
ncbi:hypothetical protein C1646_777693 [Rhizophagus diaphanus]|nr:hypothetical protein C1646_777693 [Rhizophagus diaphanus] [Rhizophagus sp. MUCL 43196]